MKWVLESSRPFYSGVEARRFAAAMRGPGRRVTIRRKRLCFDLCGAHNQWTVRVARAVA
jgi:hypothetical protein